MKVILDTCFIINIRQHYDEEYCSDIVEYLECIITGKKSTLYGVLAEISEHHEDTTWATKRISDVRMNDSDEDVLLFVINDWPENDAQYKPKKFYKDGDITKGDIPIIKFMHDHKKGGAIVSHDKALLVMARNMSYKRYCLKSVMHNYHNWVPMSCDNKSGFLFQEQYKQHFWGSFLNEKVCKNMCCPNKVDCITRQNPPINP